MQPIGPMPVDRCGPKSLLVLINGFRLELILGGQQMTGGDVGLMLQQLCQTTVHADPEDEEEQRAIDADGGFHAGLVEHIVQNQ